MKYKVILLFCTAILTFCTRTKKNLEEEQNYEDVRKEINTFFKGAVPYDDYTDSLLVLLYAVHRMAPAKILLGQSVCVDDATGTAFQAQDL